MRLLRLAMVGTLALSSAIAMAQPRGASPADKNFPALTPDDAAERLIDFCAEIAKGGTAEEMESDVQRAFRRSFPDRPPDSGPRQETPRGLSHPWWTAIYVDVTTSDRLMVNVYPRAPSCNVGSADGT